MKCLANWLSKSQLPGILIGAVLALASSYAIEMQKQSWAAENMAAAFVGEISAIIENQNTGYLKSLLEELNKEKVWEPIDQPPDRFFTIYEAAAPNLGVLKPKIVREIARFYSLKNSERAKLRTLGAGERGYKNFELSDKKVFLNAYIKLNNQLKESGQKIIDALQIEYHLQAL
jgi:hypothetical protein